MKGRLEQDRLEAVKTSKPVLGPQVILNLPLLPLLAVVRSSPALLALADKAAGPVLPKVLTVPKTYHHIKLCKRSLPLDF